jgi:hypothetical protein
LPGAAIFEGDMLLDILFIADWKKIGEHTLQTVVWIELNWE